MKTKAIPVMLALIVVLSILKMDAFADPYPWADQKLPPMVLEKHGQFWAGGQIVKRTQPGLENDEILVGQAHVEYFIPQNKHKNAIPIVMTHSESTGRIWLTTPDGREGWAHFFIRHGFPVYIVDPAGTGHAGFNVDQFNRVKSGLVPPSSQPALGHNDSSSWEIRNNGPNPRVLGVKDPSCIGNDGRGIPPVTCYGWRIANDEEAYKHYLAVGLPTGPNPTGGTTPGLIAVLEKIGPAIWLGWSDGGLLGGSIVSSRPELFAALVGVEPKNSCLYEGFSKGAVQIPALSIHSINQIGRPHESGPPIRFSRADCEAIYDKINAAGGNATWLSLYDIGIYGNSHMMFWEDNSDKIAEIILDWIIDEKNKIGGKNKSVSGNMDSGGPMSSR